MNVLQPFLLSFSPPLQVLRVLIEIPPLVVQRQNSSLHKLISDPISVEPNHVKLSETKIKKLK